MAQPVVVVQQVGVAARPGLYWVPPVGVPMPWATGICDCFQGIPTCMDGWCCCWCALASQYNMVTTGLKGMNLPVCAGTACLDCLFAGGLAEMCLTLYMRNQIRTRYNIEGTIVVDCLTAFFCGPCAIAQQTKEMAAWVHYPGGVCSTTPPLVPLRGAALATQVMQVAQAQVMQAQQ